MGAIRRFNALEEENSVLFLRVDTSKIVSGATNGSENPLTYRIPVSNTNINKFTIKVNDGRPDVSIVGVQPNTNAFLITFATSGIYEIIITGTVDQFSHNQSYGFDKLKLIYATIKGNQIGVVLRSFYLCSNLVFDVLYPIKLRAGNNSGLFHGIYKLDGNIALIDVSSTTDISAIVRDINQPLNTPLNSFYNGITIFNQVYYGTDMSGVSQVDIISDSITAFSQSFTSTNFRGILKILCPNLTTISRLIFGVTNPPALGWVDIRNCTSITDLFQYVMSTTNVDSTLNGWQNNFDWSGIPSIPNKVTIDFKNSKYSSNSLAAKTFLESKGILFTNLTMV